MLWTRTWTRQLRRASVSHKPFFIPIPIFRSFAVKAPVSLTAGEQHIFNILNDKLDPSALVIQDVSGQYSSILINIFKYGLTFKNPLRLQEVAGSFTTFK